MLTPSAEAWHPPKSKHRQSEAFRRMSCTSTLVCMSDSKPHRKTCEAIDEPGHAHALTFSCYKRQPFLSRERTCLWTIDSIRQAADKHRFSVWAYVLMPEHVHLLVKPTGETYSTSDFLRSIKKTVAIHAIRFVREHAPEFLSRMEEKKGDGSTVCRFWQKARGYDRNLWEPRYVYEMIDYIHANPVRRNLCDRPEDWRWSSAVDYAGIRSGPIAIDFGSLPIDPRQ